jgi:outer membrane receptor for ferrienterochelin and colicins
MGGKAALACGHEVAPVYELDPLKVVSTATRTERLAAEHPIRTELLTPELFRAAGTPDLASALAYLPGARVEVNCQNCGTSEVKLLGLGAGYNQLLFDGQPLFSGLAAVYGLEHVPTAFIERIEVVKGGASSLYGPGAVAGVVNIIPREPLISQVFLEASVEAFDGPAALSGIGVWDWAHPHDRAAASVYGEYRENEAIDLDGDGFSEVTATDFHTGGVNLWLYPADGNRVSANYAYTWEERRGGELSGQPPHATRITEQLEHHWQRGGLFWEGGLGPDFRFRLGGSVSHIERDSYYGGVGDVALPGQPGFDAAAYAAAVEQARLLYGFTESTSYYLDSMFTRSWTRHTLSFGAQYKIDEVFDEKRDDANQPLRGDGSLAARSGEDPIADGAFDNLGFFIQNEWDPAADWTLIGGVRADKHSELDEWVLSPRLAARYTVNPEWLLRASVSTGFRAPEIFDEDFHIEILDDPTRTRNAPGLKEESSVSYAAGFVWTPAFADNRLQADVEFHRTRIDNTFNVPDVVFTDAAGAFKLRRNAGGSFVQGFEANVLYRFTEALSAEAGVNYTDARFDAAQEVIPGIFERRHVESPRWSGVAQLNYLNADVFDVFLGLVYTGPMIAVNEVDGYLNRDTGHFFVVDLSIRKHIALGRAWDAPHLDITLGVRNLFDQRQDDITSGPNRDPGYFYGPRLPRSFFLTAAYHF